MRLNRLDLIRYGRFSDAQIEFPKPSSGSPDVTVIFGRNEAGKSTAFNGFLELLFGFKSGAHPYAFRFERSDLLVGAALDLPGRGPLVLRRNSKRSQSLLDAQGRPIQEAILSGALHGLTRSTYEERFSLNDTGLREGGARIAAAQGDLGQLLHAGLSGLTGMAQTLDALTERADRFHKKRARGTVLKVGTDRLKQIGRELRADRLTSERERSLRADRDRASSAFAAADAALRQVFQRQAAAQAATLWYERTQQMGQFSDALEGLPEGPNVAPDAGQQVAGLVEKIAALTARIAEQTDEIAGLDQVIADHPVDELEDPLRAELDRLDRVTLDGASLIGRASTARADLDKRRADRDGLQKQIDEGMIRLGIPDAPGAVAVLASLDLEGLAAAVQSCLAAALSADAADKALQTARGQQGDAPAAPQDLTALRAAFEAWEAVADTSVLEASQSQAAARLTKAAAALPAAWPELIAAGLPVAETLEDVGRRAASLRADLAAARENLAARMSELAEAEADLATHEGAPDAVDSATLETMRRTRDHLWHQHRADLTAQSADMFEAALHADDSARAHFLTGSEARQRRAAAQGQMRSAEARRDAAQGRYDALVAEDAQLSERCGLLARALGLAPDTPPTAFGARHHALTTAADAAADLSNANKALAKGCARQAAACEGLTHAARTLGLEPGAGELPDRVRRALTLEDSDRKAWANWQDGQATLKALAQKAQQCRLDLDAAQAQLDVFTAALPVPERSAATLQKALPDLRQLRTLLTQHHELAERIQALEQAIRLLSDGAARLAGILGMPAGSDPIEVIDSARARVLRAARAAEKRAEAEARKATLSLSLRGAETQLAGARQALQDCFKGQGGQDLEPRTRMDRLVQRDDLRRQKARADSERQQARGGVVQDLFDEELARMPDTARAHELEQMLNDAQQERDAALSTQRDTERHYQEAFEAADRSDLATEQATLIEELSTGARQAAVVRLGVLAARGALRRLAAERRSSMLRDVEEAFVTMTKPAWSGVDVWTQAEDEKLVGIQPDGSPVPVEQMSTGTMGQLYFALRLAGYRSFARDPGPLPMVLDDIMETFDDSRARAALRLCAEIGSSGQAILFTHHAHLVELARDTIAGVAVVNMPD